LEDSSSDNFYGEAAQERTFLWRDFFIGKQMSLGASVQYRGQQRERAHHSLGTSFSGSGGKACEELAMYTGSIVFHYLLYLFVIPLG
jgi:hypothetical protein